MIVVDHLPDSNLNSSNLSSNSQQVRRRNHPSPQNHHPNNLKSPQDSLKSTPNSNQNNLDDTETLMQDTLIPSTLKKSMSDDELFDQFNTDYTYPQHGTNSSTTNSLTDRLQDRGDFQNSNLYHNFNYNIQPLKRQRTTSTNLLTYIFDEISACTNDGVCDKENHNKISNKSSKLYAEKYKRVLTFFKLPKELETFIIFGQIACSDAILHLVTFVPITIVTVIIRYFWFPVTETVNVVSNVTSINNDFSQDENLVDHGCVSNNTRQSQSNKNHKNRIRNSNSISNSSRLKLSYSELVCFFKFILLILGICFTYYLNPTYLYHVIKSHQVIKLYIMYNMLEIGDRLLASFGQDCLDALLERVRNF